MAEFDTIIIGAGPAGYQLAYLLSSKGEKVAVVERDTPGGTCLNRGCIPTKYLVAVAGAVSSARNSSEFGVEVDSIKVDFGKAAEGMKSVVATLVDGVRGKLKGCTCYQGDARVVSPSEVEVGGETIRAAHRLVIATGSVPSILPIPGADLCITSDEALAMTSLPKSMTIIGGGVIGIEFASVFSDLGVEVHVVEFCKEILPPFDPETAKRLRTTLSRRGLDIITNARVTSVTKDGDKLVVEYEGKKGLAKVESEVVLMAVGRKPCLPEGIENTGVNVSPRGYIEVDRSTLEAAPGVYAIGDVNGLSMLAHSAEAQARSIAEANPGCFAGRAVPSIVFSRPEVAQVGATPQSLDAQGVVYTSVKHMYAANGKAQASGHAEGYLKMLAGQDGRLLGVSIIGAHAGDLIAEATILVEEGVKVDEIASKYIHAHPTLSELFI